MTSMAERRDAEGITVSVIMEAIHEVREWIAIIAGSLQARRRYNEERELPEWEQPVLGGEG